jgi:nucleoside 2-deoxyribosyltransferase
MTTCGDSSQAKGQERPVYYIYLAGPEVFLPEPAAAGAEKKAIIRRLSEERDWPFRLEGLYPLDNEIPDFALDRATGIRIYRANMGQLARADAMLVNMVRFRGPSMDAGSAFEMGVARGMGKPVFAYYDAAPFYGVPEEPGLYAERVAAFYGLGVPGSDRDGNSVESFAMADNLMMMGAIDDAGFGIETDFAQAIMNAAAYFLRLG